MEGRKAKVKPEAKYALQVNRHKLSGVKHGGKWAWACPSFPDLVDAHNGAADGGAMIEAFIRRAMGQDEGDQQKASA